MVSIFCARQLIDWNFDLKNGLLSFMQNYSKDFFAIRNFFLGTTNLKNGHDTKYEIYLEIQKGQRFENQQNSSGKNFTTLFNLRLALS